MTKPLTNEQRAEAVYSLLRVGVPPTAIAKAFKMDPEHVTAARAQMHVERYGTDEKAEAMDFLIWEAVEEAFHQIRHGTPTNRLKFCAMVLSRSVGVAGRSTPEQSDKIREALAQMTQGLEPEAHLTESIYES